jgi:hypothetical protein
MFVVGALFGLVTVGFVVPCLIDVAVAPDCEVRGMTKPWWVLVLVFFSALGAVAWLIAGRPRSYSRMRMRLRLSRLYDEHYISPQEAIRRHPAGRAAEMGYDGEPGEMVRSGSVRARPDDDPGFLDELTRRIRRGDEAGNDA